MTLFRFETQSTIFDSRPCELGEGSLWHPVRNQLFWFDILQKRLLTKINGVDKGWQFNECVSSAGWVDVDNLLIASETKLFTFNVETGECSTVVELEAANLLTRSNDGRADPWGGFWVSTMGKNAEPHLGAIYRYYEGRLIRLVDSVTIPNSICFSKLGSVAYYADTDLQLIYRQALVPETGWPEGEPKAFVDFSDQGLNPDGAVVDSEGNLWCALWGASKVVCISAEGKLLGSVDVPAQQPTCPAFGGDDYTNMYVSSAAVGLNERKEGLTFVYKMPVKGIAESYVRL